MSDYAKRGSTTNSKEENQMARSPWVDQDMCISCGICVDNVPDVFRFADNGKAECYNLGGASEDEIQSGAIDMCPVECIHWKD